MAAASTVHKEGDMAMTHIRPDVGLMRRALETLRIRTDWDTDQSADEVARFIVLEYERQREWDLIDDLRRQSWT